MPRARAAAPVRGALLASTGLVSVLWGVPAAAGPADPTVAAGGVVIGGSGAHTQITQSSQRAIVDWRSFSLEAGERVSVAQPGSGSVLLNRVRGTDPSVINGTIDANGQVMLVNPNGVMIGAGGRIDAAGFLATTSDIADADFMAGRYVFGQASGLQGAAIVNDGVIRVGQGGYAALSAAMVSNRGLIEARLGSIVLGGAETFTLDLFGDGLLRYEITQGSQGAADGGALVRNAGRLVAQGGQVLMTARAVKDVLGHVINTTGIVEATGVQEKNGRIVIVAEEGGDVAVSGVLDASAAAGVGGAVDVTGGDVTLSAATVDVSGAAGGGRVRLGGDQQGQGDLPTAQNLTIDAVSTVRADATVQGDGGRIIAWSDGTTRADGALSVRGGAEGGDGGFIETSGKGLLAVSGRIDLTSPFGNAGEWLLDPTEITIQDGTDTGTYSGSVVTVGTLEGIGSGTITLQADELITVADLSGDQTINLRSDVSIVLQTVNADTSRIVFADPNDGITASGSGSITLFASTDNKEGFLGNSNSSQPIGRLTTAGGSITLKAADGITLAGAINSNGGAILIDGNSDNGCCGQLTIAVPITTGGGNLELKSGSGGIVVNSNVDVGGGDLLFTSNGPTTLGGSTTARSVTFDTSGTTTLAGTITASSGDIEVGALTISSNAAIVAPGTVTVSGTLTMSSGSSIRLRGAAVDLTSAGYSGKSNGSITLEPYTASQSIAVNGTGSSFNVPTGVMSDLQGFNTITIGRSDGTGALTIPNAIASYNGNLVLLAGGSGGTITQGNAVTLDAGKTATYSAGGDISLTTALTAPGGITLTSNADISATSLVSSGGAANITAVGDVSIGTSLNASSGSNVTAIQDIVLAGTITLAGGSNLVLSGTTIDLSGVTAFSGVSSSSTITLQQAHTGWGVVVNGATADGDATTLDITSGTLAKVTNTGIGANFGTVIIGRENGEAPVTLATDLTLATALTLRSGGGAGSISQTGNVTLTGTGGLTYTAGGAITQSGTVTLNGGALSFYSGATLTQGGAITLTGTGALSLTAGFSLVQNATITHNGSGTISLSAGSGIAINQAVASTGGGVTIDADNNNDGSGTATVAAAVTSDGGALTFNSAADLQIASLGTSSASRAGGNITFADPVTLSRAAGVTLVTTGSGGNGSITFSGTVDSYSTGAVPLTLNTGTGGITFTGNAGVARALGTVTLTGTGAVSILGSLYTTPSLDLTGHALTLGSNTAIETTGTLTLPASVMLNGGGVIRLRAAVLDLGATTFGTSGGYGDITLEPASAGTDILINGAGETASFDVTSTILSKLGSFGILTIGRTDGTGQISFAAATDRSATSNALVLRAGGSGGSISQGYAVTLATGKAASYSAGGNISVTAALTAPGGITLSATDAITLSGSLNAGSGSLNVTAGQGVAATAAISAGSGLSMVAGGTLSASTLAPIIVSSGAATIRSTGAMTLAGGVSAIGVTVSGSDAVTLSGTLSGGAGNSSITAGRGLGITAAVTTTGSATLSLTAGSALSGSLTALGTLSASSAISAGGAATIRSTGAMTLSGGVAGIGVTVSGSDAVTLSGTLNGRTGNSSVTAGQGLGITAAVTTTGSATLSLSAGGTLSASSAITAGGAATIRSTGAMALSGGISGTGVSASGSGAVTLSGTLAAGSGIASVTAGQALDVTAAVSGAGGISLTAGGMLSTSAAGTLTSTGGGATLRATGAMAVAGTISSVGASLSGADAVTLSGTLAAGAGTATVAAGGALDITAPISASGSGGISLSAGGTLSASSAAPIAASGGAATIRSTGAMTLAGGVSGTGATVSGSDAVTLSGTLSAGSGTASVTAGQGITATAALTAGNLVLAAGTDLDLSATPTLTGSATLTAGRDLDLTGVALTAPSGLSLTATRSLTADQALSSSGGSARIRAGIASLSGTVTATGIDVSASDALTLSGALGATVGSLLLAAGDDLSLSAAATASAGATLTAGGDLALTAALTAPSGISLGAGGTLSASQALTATSGAATLRSTGAMTVSTPVTATSLDFSAGDALTLSGTLSATAGGIVLTAGTDLTLQAAATATGAATLTAGEDLALTALLTAPSGATLRAGRSLGVTGTAAGVLTTNAAIVLNADRDASGGGDILVGDGATLVSNGGDITLGGGAAPSSGVAQGLAIGGVAGGRGIQVTGAARIDARGTANGGAILLRGTAAGGVASAIGVDISGGATLQTSHSGTLTLVGTGASGTTLSAGVSMGGGVTLATANGAIAITGTSSGAGTNPYGVLFDRDPSGRTRVYSTGGAAIAITASGSDAALAGATDSQAQIGTDGTTTYASAITLTADRMAIGTLAVRTSAAATLRTGSAGQAVDLGSTTDGASGTLELSAAELAAISAGTLTIGRNDSGFATGQMRLTGAVSAATGGTLALVAGGIVQSAGTLTTGTLAAVSSGAITLAQGNSFGTLASASAAGAIDIRRAGGALTVTGAVSAGANGVTLATAGGDLTLGASSSVTTTGANDIVLSTDGNFIFTTGATLSAGRKYLVYSTNPDNDVRGGLTAGQYLWNRTLSTQAPGDLTDSINRFIYSYQPTVTVTAADKTKVYGDADPTLTFTATGFRFDDTDAVLTGALGRDSGEDTGSHTIRQGTLESPTGYAITFSTGTLSVTPATLTVTPDNLTKIYGDDDPTRTYSLTGLKLGDTASVMSGLAGRDTGEDVGTYTLGLGTLSGGTNYTLVLASTPKTLTITPAPLTITPNVLDKPYGGADPAFTYSAAGFKRTDTVSLMTGALTRATGETLGTYALGVGTLSAGGNYTLTLVPQNFTIRRDRLTVTAHGQTKVYGDSDPGLSWTVVGEVASDGAHLLTGGLSRDGGENVGAYGIGIGSLAADSNYEVTYVGASLTISQATLTVTPTAQTKVYGDADPTLGYSVSGLRNGDGTGVVGGSLTRTAGNTVGSYGISLGSLSAGGNYKIEMGGAAALTITPAPLSVSAPLLSRIYGDADPTLSLTVTGLRNGDSQAAVLSGSVDRAAGENVGSYDITQGGLTANANYTLSFTPGRLTITPAALTVSAQAAGKTYGESDPTFGITITGLKNGDSAATALSGSVARTAGAGVGSYGIGQGSLTASANYTMTFTGSTFTIAPRQLIITANSVQRQQRQDNPALTVSYAGFAPGEGESVVDGLTLSTGADANSAPGSYAIELAGASAANYTVTLVNGVLTVIPANSPALPSDVAENAPITAITNIPQAPVPPTTTTPVATTTTAAAGGGGSGGGSGGGAGPGSAGGAGSSVGGAPAGSLSASRASSSGPAPGTAGAAGAMPQSVSLSVADQVLAAASGLAGDDGSSTSEVLPGLLNQQTRVPTAVPEGVPGIEQNFPSLGKGY